MTRKVVWADEAWQDFQYFEERSPKLAQRVIDLLKSIQETPFSGIGKPEALKYQFAGYWSRRVNHEHRLVYSVTDDAVYVAQVRYHY